jgi:PAS domain S-box-containing protein
MPGRGHEPSAGQPASASTDGVEVVPVEAVDTGAGHPEEGGDPACWAHLAGGHAGTEALPVTDELLAEVLRAAGDGVVVADADGRIAVWNAAAERIFGWTAEEAVGESLDLIIPERNRNAHWGGYEKVMATGQTRYGEELLRVPALHRDGSRRSIAFTVALLTGSEGRVRGIAAVIRDETARRAEEQELRKRVASLEAAAAGGSGERT